jgi:hypothetical protein
VPKSKPVAQMIMSNSRKPSDVSIPVSVTLTRGASRSDTRVTFGLLNISK